LKDGLVSPHTWKRRDN